MTRIFSSSLACLALLSLGTAARADVSATYSDVHLCCGACVRDVQKAVGEVAGAKVSVDAKAGTVTISAADAKTLKAAAKSMADAGYHGACDKEEFALADDSGASADKVQRIVLTGTHNCCGGCKVAIVDACESVNGVQAVVLKSKETSCVVEGDFIPKDLVKALNAAGFHVKVAK